MSIDGFLFHWISPYSFAKIEVFGKSTDRNQCEMTCLPQEVSNFLELKLTLNEKNMSENKNHFQKKQPVIEIPVKDVSYDKLSLVF